jgi:cytochrome c-type biogenesis protein CcmH/NrfG
MAIAVLTALRALRNRMLNRLTVAALLKSVIAVMATCVVAVLSVSVWSSWERLQTAGRVTVIADASATAFKAMHNLRSRAQPPPDS